MEVLWLAIFLYTIGLGLVLHFRPALMFHTNGSWKEFGYQRDSRHTLFPFWLFAVAWALVSYAVAAAVSAIVGGSAGAAAAASAATWLSRSASTYDDESDLEEEGEEVAVPISRARNAPPSRKATTPPTRTKKPRSGYYVLDPDQNAESGLRRYIYYGPEPPAEEEA